MEIIDNEELQPEEITTESAEPTEQTPVSTLPEKYSGKSIEDIVRMHQEAEKLIGRQAQEVGDVRRLADELLKQQLPATNKETVQEDSEIDFFEDPKKAVRKAVDSHPDVIAAKQATQQMKAMQTQNMLNQKHPDFASVIQDVEFKNWVDSSPMRRNMYAMADTNYNFDAADELLSTFKQIKSGKTQQSTEAGAEMRQKNLRAASVDVSGSGESSQKVYRREDLIRLRMTDPTRYEALQPEIMAAYADGRVK